MAGSYEMARHDILESDEWPGLVENMGDAYEALEECVHMIAVLAEDDPARIDAAHEAALERIRGAR